MNPAQKLVVLMSGSVPAAPGTVVPGAILDLSPFTNGNWIDITRVSDLTVQTFTANKHKPNLAAIAAFLNDGVGIGYVTKRYDQSGNGNHATQTVLASAPKIVVSNGAIVTPVLNGVPAIVYDYNYRNNSAGLTTYAVTSFVGAVLQMTAAVPTWWAPGMTVSGTNLASTAIVSIDFTLNKVTVAAGPSGAVGNLTIVAKKVWMDLPAGVAIALNSHALFSVGAHPGIYTVAYPLVVGEVASTAFSTGTTWSMDRIGGGGTVSVLRLVAQTGGNNNNYTVNVAPSSFVPHCYPAVYGFNRNVKAINWYAEELSGSGNSTSDPGSASITTGSLAFTQQFVNPATVIGGDWESYADMVYPASIGAANSVLLKSSFIANFKIPTITQSIVFDGSSTTSSLGTALTSNVGRKTCDLLTSAGIPCRALNVGNGQTIEAMYQVYATQGAGPLYNASTSKLLVVHPGLGNSLQSSGAFTITGVAGAVLTISTSMAYPSNASIGSTVTVSGGGASVPAGTTIIATNSASNPTTVTLSNAPSGGTPTTMTVQNQNGIQAWANIVTYLQAARASGYQILLVGSATRGTFTGAQQTQFDAAKTLMNANWATYADAYLDLQSIAQFAGTTPWVTYPDYWLSDHQHFTDLGYALIAANTQTTLASAGLTP